MLRQPQFLKWIKIRIGEPLTALDMNDKLVIFGSISGYIGLFRLDGGSGAKYIQNTFEQLIRAIYLNNQKAYAAIGDRQTISFDCQTFKYQSKKLVNQRTHNATICSYSMSLLYKQTQVIFCAYPTQKKQSQPNELDRERNTLYEINIIKNQISQHKDFNIPQVSVPFDFDGTRVLWMQYKQQGIKQFQYYDLPKKQIIPIVKYGKQYQFLSYGRLYKNQLIYVENNKNVKTYNIQTKAQATLYSHTSSIIAFDIDRTEQGYQIISVDYNAILSIWRKGEVLRTIRLLQTNKVPAELRKHKYLFDMGYPYYVKLYKDHVAVTCDLGLCIFKI